MNYKKYIDPELKPIARKMPYNRAIIRLADVFLPVIWGLTPVPEGIASRSIAVEGHRGLKVKTEIFEPSTTKEKLPCLIYVHGGAFSYRASAYHKKLACMYAMRANCRVYFPDYHLTPKYPYPAAYEDVLALYKYLAEHSEELGIDSEKIGLAGDSAGGCIAALICANYQREGLRRPCLQMLVYPATDIDMKTDSMKRFSDTPLWNAKNNRRMLAYYCGSLKEKDTKGAFPMHSSLPRTIPDTFIETAEYDCLHDEGILYAEKLRKAGASVEINETKGTFHGYDSALNTKIAMRNVEKRILFLRKGFNS